MRAETPDPVRPPPGKLLELNTHGLDQQAHITDWEWVEGRVTPVTGWASAPLLPSLVKDTEIMLAPHTESGPCDCTHLIAETATLQGWETLGQ